MEYENEALLINKSFDRKGETNFDINKIKV